MGQTNLSTHVLIIGGGIVGSGLFRDLALHGVETILIDKKDFNSQTSQSSSKMLHGGIRYLQNYDFALVREALYEKNLWLKLAPHLVREKKFLMPNFKDSPYPLWMLWCGVKLYDFLSGFKNKRSHTLSKENTLKILPELSPDNLKGAAVYYDSVVDDAKLGLECIYDALLEENAKALNYTEIIKIEKEGETYCASVRNTLTQTQFKITAKEIIFATGPFSDQIIPSLGFEWGKKMFLSKGSHLWIKKEALDIGDEAMVIQTKEGRLIFVIPEREAILVGTTEIALEDNENIFDIKASEKEIDYLLYWLNQYFVKANIDKSQIISTFAGVRPLVKQPGIEDRSKTSRHHLIYHIKKNVHAIFGGKYTTFRVMGQELTELICKRIGIKYDKTKSLQKLRQRSLVIFDNKLKLDEELINKLKDKELAQTHEDIIKRRLSSIESLDIKSDS